jgi:4-amino-4-deoxy-L-arabinose transferase-like glycosyltransferase
VPEHVPAESADSRLPWLAWILPAATLALHLVTYAGYGYFRDELYYLANGEHLGFGYVEHPPLIGLMAWFVRHTLGDSLFAIRLLPALAAAATVWMTMGIAREMGGGRFAQALAGLSTILAPMFLGLFGVFTVNAFDLAFWAALWWIAARYLRTGRERLWVVLGLVAGVGLQNKISVLFLGFGLVIGLLLGRRWGAFRRRWLWIGGAIAAFVFLPYIVWQVANGWPTLEFMRNAITRKNVVLSPAAFLGTQVLSTLGTAPVWVAGLAFLLLARGARPFRPLGWAFLAVVGIMLTTNAKPYYLAPAFIVPFAAGGVAFESLSNGWFGTALRTVAVVVVLAGGIVAAPIAKAILPEDAYVRYARALKTAPAQEERQSLGRLPQTFADMHGWRDLAETVSRIYHDLPARDQARACIFAHNYGQAGAIDLFGPRLGLPKAISGHNSYFLWGPRGCTGEVMIIIDGRLEDHASDFASLELAAIFSCVDCMPYENHKPIWIARGLKVPMTAAWPGTKDYI